MNKQEILNQINKYQDLLESARNEKEQNFVQNKINYWESKLISFEDEEKERARLESERIENERIEKEMQRIENERIEKEKTAKKKKKEFNTSDDFLDTDSMVEQHQSTSKSKADILRKNKKPQ